jgi:hypothetical protein
MRLSEPSERMNRPQGVKVRPCTLPWCELPDNFRSLRLLYLTNEKKNCQDDILRATKKMSHQQNIIFYCANELKEY